MQTKNSRPEALIVGDILMDSQYWVRSYPVCGGDETIFATAENAGGSAANTAVALRAQGISCAFHGRVGDDKLGGQLIAQMENLGVDISCLDIFGGTGYTVTMIDPSGERTMFSYRESEGYKPKMTRALKDILSEAKVLYVSGYLLLDAVQANFATDLAREARACGCHVMLDTAPVIGRVDPLLRQAFLEFTDVLMPNKEELLTLAGRRDVQEAIDILMEIVPCLVVKLGGEGSRLVARSGFRLMEGEQIAKDMDIRVAAEKVTPLDTTGAGDSFNAGFIAAFLKGESAENWLATGNKLAAKAISCRGAIACYL